MSNQYIVAFNVSVSDEIFTQYQNFPTHFDNYSLMIHKLNKEFNYSELPLDQILVFNMSNFIAELNEGFPTDDYYFVHVTTEA